MKLVSMDLSAIAEVRSGGGAPQDPDAYTSTGHPFVRAGSLPKLLGGACEDSLEKLEPAIAAQYGLSLFPTGTVLFAKSGMSATKGHVYRLRKPAYVVNHLAALVPHKIEDSGFLVRVLQRYPPTVLIKDSAYPSIRLCDIEQMKVLAPSHSAERMRIAEVLDQAEALKVKCRASLAKLDTLTQAIFFDMFGDPTANPKAWPVYTIKNVADIIVPTRDKPRQFNGIIPWVTLPDLDELYVSTAKHLLSEEDAAVVSNRLIPASSVLLSCAATLGKVAINTVPVYANQQFYGLLPHRGILNAEYLAVCLMAKGEHFFARLGGSFTIGFFSKQRALGIQIPIPALQLQSEFARRLFTLEKIKAMRRISLTELDALFASLQHRAFRGEL
jgi:type I restriction enzyme, S subunit